VQKIIAIARIMQLHTRYNYIQI